MTSWESNPPQPLCQSTASDFSRSTLFIVERTQLDAHFDVRSSFYTNSLSRKITGSEFDEV